MLFVFTHFCLSTSQDFFFVPTCSLFLRGLAPNLLPLRGRSGKSTHGTLVDQILLLEGALYLQELPIGSMQIFVGSLGVSPTTSVIQGNPPYEKGSLWEALFVVSQKGSFPTALEDQRDLLTSHLCLWVCDFIFNLRPGPGLKNRIVHQRNLKCDRP